MANVIIVSNRLPVSVKKVDGKLEFYPSVGGLATGLASYVTQKKNKWIGWPGIADEELTEKDKKTIVKELEKSNCYPVFLTKKQLDDFYNGYSNSILWPLLHSLPFEMDNYARYWKSYQEINAVFTEAVTSLGMLDSTVWVHDYQLMLVPAQLRAERPAMSVGFFLHIPFPETKIFKKLPDAASLLAGLLGGDLVGFHTQDYTANFMDACASLLPEAILNKNEVIMGSRVVRITDFPISIDYQKFSLAGDSLAVKKQVRKLRKKYDGMKIILTVDRLDPTKGLVGRLKAYKELLEKTPTVRRRVVLVMLAVPSRGEIKAYKELKVDVESLVDEINGTFGDKYWQPVDYMYTSLPFEELAALYQAADIAFITPIRDGMNLVAKEYLASKPEGDGVLILSSTAGAAQELTDALLVDPAKQSTMVSALEKALDMPKFELTARLRKMQNYLREHTIETWAGDFMDTLQSSSPLPRLRTRKVTYRIRQELLSRYHTARARQLFLDYDGVLRSFMGDPSLAVPTNDLNNILERLSIVPNTEVIIISGRKKSDLESWFGHMNVSLIAEHGVAIKKRGQEWRDYSKLEEDWKYIPRLIFEKYAAETPGAFVEEKEHALVWHYRKSPAYTAHKNIVIIKKVMKQALRKTELKLYGGNKILEVRSRYANKGEAAARLLKKKADFVLAMGDDYTDEHMFEALDTRAITVKVGPGRTQAELRMDSSEAVISLLNGFTS